MASKGTRLSNGAHREVIWIAEIYDFKTNDQTNEDIEGHDDRSEDLSDQDNWKQLEELQNPEIIDICLTGNQTKILQEILRNKITRSIKKSAKAIAGVAQVRLCDENYDAAEDRFLLVYYFDSNGSHTEKQKDLIRNSFDQFGDYTCVKLVEVSSNDNRFKHKLQIKSGNSRYSYVGLNFEHQEILLGKNCDYSTYVLKSSSVSG